MKNKTIQQIQRAIGCYFMSAGCKVIEFHKWSMKLAEMSTDRTLVTCFKYNFVSLHDNFLFMFQNDRQNK